MLCHSVSIKSCVCVCVCVCVTVCVCVCVCVCVERERDTHTYTSLSLSINDKNQRKTTKWHKISQIFSYCLPRLMWEGVVSSIYMIPYLYCNILCGSKNTHIKTTRKQAHPPPTPQKLQLMRWQKITMG